MPYKAFISYKHVTSTMFASKLESALKEYAKPLFAPPVRIFRDEKHLSPGVNLPSLITDALDQSEYLLLLASKEAGESPWVRRELEYWCGKLGRVDRLIIILTKDRIVVDEERQTIVWDQTDALPAMLQPYISSVPLYVDFTPLDVDVEEQFTLSNAAFKQRINGISAKLRGIDPNDMMGEEIRQHKRTVRIRNTAVVMLATLAIVSTVASVFAINNGNAARQRARQAISRNLASQSRLVSENSIQTSTLLGIEALSVSMRAEDPIEASAEAALRDVLAANGGEGLIGHHDQIFALAFDSNRTLFTGSHDGTVRSWTGWYSPSPRVESTVLDSLDVQIGEVVVDSAGRWLIAAEGGFAASPALLWRLGDGQRPAQKYTLRPAGAEVETSEEDDFEGDGTSAVAMTADAQSAITGEQDGTLRLWNLGAPDPTRDFSVLHGHNQMIVAISASKGPYFASGSRDGTILIWDLRNLKTPASRLKTAEPLEEIVLSSTGQWVVSISSSKDYTRSVSVWNIQSGREYMDIWSGEGSFTAQVSSDEKWLVVSKWDGGAGSMRLWKLTGESLQHPGTVLRSDADRIFSSAISPDARWLASGNENDTVELWDLSASDPTQTAVTLRGHSGPAKALVFSPDSRYLAVGTGAGEGRIWDLFGYNASTSPAVLRPDGRIVHTYLHRDGRRLTVVSERSIEQWQLSIENGGEMQVRTTKAFKRIPIDLTSDAHAFIVEDSVGNVQLWQVNRGQPRLRVTLRASPAGIDAMVFSARLNFLLLGHADGRLQVLDLAADGSPTWRTLMDPDPIDADSLGMPARWRFKMSNNGQWLAAGRDNVRLYFWNLGDADRWNAKKSLSVDFTPTVLRFSADGTWFGAGGNTGAILRPGRVRLWRLGEDGIDGMSYGFAAQEHEVVAMEFSNNGKLLVTAGAESTIKVWNLPSIESKLPSGYTLRGHGDGATVTKILFSGSDEYLFTASDDGMIIKWILVGSSAATPIHMRGHFGSVTDLEMSSDERVLYSVGEDGIIAVWLVSPVDLIRTACKSVGRDFSFDEWNQYFGNDEYRKTCPRHPRGRNTDYNVIYGSGPRKVYDGFIKW